MPTTENPCNQANGSAAGDAFSAVVRDNIGWVHCSARRQLGDSNVADDATQAVFLALWRKRKRLLTNDRAIGGWLMRAVHYACNDLRKAKRRRENHERKAAAMRSADICAPDGNTEPNTGQLSALDAAMLRLPTGDRDILVARFFQNQTARQIAQAFDISEAAAEKRLTRAVIKLRGIMARKHISLDNMAITALLAGGAGTAPSGLLEKVIQCAGGKAATSSTAAHAARSIAFHNAQVPAIAGTAAVALAVGVAAVVPLQTLQVKMQPGSAGMVPGASPTGGKGDEAACVDYLALVDRNFVAALRKSGRLIPGESNGVQAYNIRASTVRSLFVHQLQGKQVTLSEPLNWTWYPSIFPQIPQNGGIPGLTRQFTQQPEPATISVSLFPQIYGHMQRNSIRLKVGFKTGSAISIDYFSPKAKQPSAELPYTYNRTFNIGFGRAVVLLKHAMSHAGSQWYTATVFDVESYPTRDQELCGRISNLNLYLKEGPAGLRRMAAVAVAWRKFARQTQTASKRGGSQWTKSLPGGVQVTLQAIGSELWPLCSWNPEGQPRASGGCTLSQSFPAGYVEASLLFKAPAKSAGSWPGRQVFGGMVSGFQRTYVNLSLLRIGLDSGPWKIIGPATPATGPQAFTAPKFLYDGKQFYAYNLAHIAPMPGGPLATPASVSMLLALLPQSELANRAVAVGALTRRGRLVAPEPGYMPTAFSGDVFERIQTSRYGAFSEYGGGGETIPVASSHIKSYVWITRPRYWVTFRGFALKPSPLPSVIFAMAGHDQQKPIVPGAPAGSPPVGKKNAAIAAGRATPEELVAQVLRDMRLGRFESINKLCWAPTPQEKKLAVQANNDMAATFGFGLWPLAEKRFGAAQLQTAGITKQQLGWPEVPAKNPDPTRWKITGRFAAPVQTPGRIVTFAFFPSAHATLIREHGLWYINFNLTSAKMRQVRGQLRRGRKFFHKYFPNAKAYKAVLTELQAGKIKDAYALRDALAAALKKYSAPHK